MAEVSALNPSPPAMAEQSVAPLPPSSSPAVPAESPKPLAVPKSALYGDRAVLAAAAVVTTPPLKETSVCLLRSHEGTSTRPEIPPPVTSTSESTCPPVRGEESSPAMCETLTQPDVSPEPPGKAARFQPEIPQRTSTMTSMSTSHTPPPSPPSVVSFVPDQISDLPALVVHGSAAPSGPALDTLSYLESASMMSGTLESLSGIGEDGSSLGSDSELNGPNPRRTDKYGFLGGTQYSEGNVLELSVEVSRHREMKWLDMFKHWDKWISRHFPKVKLRCRKGIPSSLRARAWQLLSNSEELLIANLGKFEELERQPGDPKWLDIIEKDLHRQFPFHEMFAARGGHGQQDLYRILKAYTVYRPDEGYCQAQAPVAAVLLMHMPAEQAFWCLVQICEKYLPGYYSAGLEAIQLDGEIFFSLLRRVCPMAYRHLKKFKIDPILYMTEWFMCIFSRTLPWSCVLRVWDMFFCEGVKIVFRVGLVLLKQMLGSVDKLRELQGMYETMERLRNISPDSIKEEILVHEVTAVPVTEALIERECTIQVKKWRESRGALTHQPARRLHGTRDIHEQKRRAAAISSGGSLSFLGSSMSSPPPGPLRSSSSLLSLPGFRKSKNPFSHGKKSSFSGSFGPETQLFGGGTPIMITASSGAGRPPISAAAPPTGGAAVHKPSPLTAKPPTSPKSPGANTSPEPTPKSNPEPPSMLKLEPTLVQETGPEPTLVQETGPEPTLVQETGPEPTLVQETGPEPTLVQETGPEPTLVQETGPEPTLPQKTEPEPTLPQKTGPEPTLPQKTGPEPTLVQKTGPEPTLIQKTGPEPNLVQKTGPEPTLVQKTGQEPTLVQKTGPEPTLVQKSGPEPESTLAPKSGPEPAIVSNSVAEPVPPPTSELGSAPKSTKEATRPPIPNQLQPPRVVSEHVTPTIPSPTANNVPLPPCADDSKKKKKSKKEKEEEKQKAREKKEREKAEKEKAKKEKERAEKEKKKEKGGKKKDKAVSAEAEEKNGGGGGANKRVA